jgi:hypothetical protein
MNRRLLFACGTGLVLAAIGHNYISMGSVGDYEAEAAKLREMLAIDPELKEFVRYATLAANSHNTQPWKFALSESDIRITPDYARRTPIADPDDHHLFASLGCAAENLVLSAAARGRSANVTFDETNGGQIVIALVAANPIESELFRAIPDRQCSRSIYSGAEVSADQLKLLEKAAKEDGMDVLFITHKAKREQVYEYIVSANSAQIGDEAFATELKSWLRFNPAAALTSGDGLFSACSGNPTLPSWVGNLMFPFVFTESRENKKLVEQLRSSAGIAIFVSQESDKAHWFRAGCAYQRFALQATTLGIRNAFLNQPIEVPSVPADFARFLDLGDRRPDFVVRFGAAAALPMSLRRPVYSVLA